MSTAKANTLKNRIFKLKSYDVKDKFGNSIVTISLTEVYKILDEAKQTAPRELKETIWYSDANMQEARKWFREQFGNNET